MYPTKKKKVYNFKFDYNLGTKSEKLKKKIHEFIMYPNYFVCFYNYCCVEQAHLIIKRKKERKKERRS